MSTFLTNLAARARGTLPRLAPRRPAPFETLGDRFDPVDSDRPVSSMSTEVAASTSRTDGAVAPARVSAPVPGPTMSAAESVPSSARSAAPPITPATPAPAAPARRMVTASHTPPVAPAALARTRAITPPVAISPQTVLTAGTSPVSHAPVSPPIAPSAPAAVIPPATVRGALPVSFGEGARAGPERGVSPVASDAHPASRSSMVAVVAVPGVPAPLLPREDSPSRKAGQVPRGENASRSAQSRQSPQVEVRIGTIEVVMDPPRATQPAPVPAHGRGISLDDFLDGKGGR